MARSNLEADRNAFLSKLRDFGSAGNGALRNALGWAETRYWKAHAALFESGQIKKGRGRGGSVSTSTNRGRRASLVAPRPGELPAQRSPSVKPAKKLNVDWISSPWTGSACVTTWCELRSSRCAPMLAYPSLTRALVVRAAFRTPREANRFAG